jgi:DMSO/TMAO reductase YedYZ molybdopterin-dependent catalytic subunit
LTPIPVKEFAITHFGSHDKEALLAGIVVLLLAFAVLIGIAAVRRIAYGLAGLAAIGVAAAIHLPTATVTDVIPTLAGVIVAIPALIILVRAVWAGLPAPIPAGTAPPGSSLERGSPEHSAPEHSAPEHSAPEHSAPEHSAPEHSAPERTIFSADSADLAEVLSAGPYLGDLNPQDPPAPEPDRRRFLIAGAGAAAAAAGGLGDKLLGRFSIASSRAQVRLPAPAVRAAAVPAGTELNIPGLTPFFTSNSSFYRVDTDLVLPQVSPESWTLKIDGMVDRELEFSFADLLKMPLTETDITLVCVSNQVGGTYNGNARWLGVPLAGLLRRAGVQSGADQVLSTAVDGMTISTPLATIMDGRDALLAIGMNGQPLPIAHGFPARMIVPGLYGYVSATKWVTKLTLTTFSGSG